MWGPPKCGGPGLKPAKPSPKSGPDYVPVGYFSGPHSFTSISVQPLLNEVPLQIHFWHRFYTFLLVMVMVV